MLRISKKYMLAIFLITLVEIFPFCQPIAADEPNRDSVNLLTNGSFELGLGAEPFYPGWKSISTGLSAPKSSPDLPVIDSTVAHGGRKSLKIASINGSDRAVLEFACPKLVAGKPIYISLWARASRPGVKLIMGSCPRVGHGPKPFTVRLSGELSPDWRKITGSVPSRKYTHVRAEIYSKSKEPFDIWIDDICWTQSPHQKMLRSGPVEIVLLPNPRNGIRYADKPVRLKWSANTDELRDAKLVLQLSDLSRGGAKCTPWEKSVKLTPDPSEGEIVLEPLKRGAYLATLEARDADTGVLLGIAREKFTVMTDLRKVPAPIDFDAGMHGGLIGFHSKAEFNWRGHWTPDEFFQMCRQTGFRIQRLLVRWHAIEPSEGKYSWYLDEQIDAATRNECSTIICFPTDPVHYKRNKKQIAKSWIHQKGKDISQLSVGSALMGYSSDPKKRHLLLAPPAKPFAKTCAAIANRYKGKLAAWEMTNEANLFIRPEGLLDYYFKVAYPAIKKVYPGLPVLMNQTLDYRADGNGYTGQFFALDSMRFCDGFTHHPYSCRTLDCGGLKGVKILERIAKKYSRPNKKMILGMSEIHGIGMGGYIKGWELVQRALLDWSIGCRWSAGAVMDGAFFLEGGPRTPYFRTGARAPGLGAAALNGLYSVLGGSRIIGRADIDEKILIAFFKKSASKANKTTYTAALAAPHSPLMSAELLANLKNIPIKAFDQWGEPVEINTTRPLVLSHEVIYLQSKDIRMVKRIEAGRIVWSQRLSGHCDGNPNSPDGLAYRAETGLPISKHVGGGMIPNWKISGPFSLQDSGQLRYGTIDVGGKLLVPDQKLRIVSRGRKVPYISLIPNNRGKTLNKSQFYAHATIFSDRDERVPFSLSATGPVSVWVNGKKIPNLTNRSCIMGEKWHTFETPIKMGSNNILVRTVARNGIFAFALKSGEVLKNPPIDEKGFIRRWAIIGPWENPMDSNGKFSGNQKKFPCEARPDKPDYTAFYVGKNGMPLLWRIETAATAKISHPWADAVSYAFTSVEVPEDIDCLASLGSDDGFVLWVNGKEIGRLSIGRHLTPDETKLPVRLRKGRNTIMFKIDDIMGGGNFTLRFLQPDGTPVRLRISGD